MADLKITELGAVVTPVDADLIVSVQDVATTPTTKKSTWTVIKAFLKTYFDGLYPSGSGTSSGTNTGDNTVCTSGTATTAATLATTRAIYGNNFNGSAALTQIIASTYGGTGNGFTKFTGPATAEKTFTLPNASATLLYAGGALGTPSGGTLTNCTFPTLNQNTSGTAAGLSATLAIASGGTGATTLAGASIPTYTSTITFTNKRITQRVTTEASSATPTINTDNSDAHSITALATAITSMTTNLSGTPTSGQKLIVQITGTAARAIAWGTSFEASTVDLPTTTVTTAMLSVGFIWNAATSKWSCVAVA